MGGGFHSRETHQFSKQQDELNKCIRCKKTRTERNVDEWCKVPQGENEDIDRWLGYNFRIRERWRQRWEHAEGDNSPAEWGNFPREMLKRWKDHKTIVGKKKIACIDCGKFGNFDAANAMRTRRGWLTQPCAGIKKVPLNLRRLVEAGEFDDSLQRVPTKDGWDFRFRVQGRVRVGERARCLFSYLAGCGGTQHRI